MLHHKINNLSWIDSTKWNCESSADYGAQLIIPQTKVDHISTETIR